MQRNIQRLNAYNLFSQGFKPYEVHKELGVPTTTCERWYKKFQEINEGSEENQNGKEVGTDGEGVGITPTAPVKSKMPVLNVAYVLPDEAFLRTWETVKADEESDYERSQTIFKMYTGLFRYFPQIFKFENVNLPVMLMIAECEMKAAKGLRDGLIDTDRFAKNTRCGVPVKEEKAAIKPSDEMTAEEISIELREFSNRNRGN